MRLNEPFLILALTVLLPLAACSTGNPHHFCGDGVCQAKEGEDAETCPEDCPDVCGDGLCTGAESPVSCPADCAPTCNNPDQPVDCGDGFCWHTGTNCSGALFFCDGFPKRCSNNLDWANCCDGTFRDCPASFPYYCPIDNSCNATPPVGCPATCEYVAQDCGI
jgi:hypothetical protein